MLDSPGVGELRAIADMDGHGIANLIWEHSSGWLAVWYLNSSANHTARAASSGFRDMAGIDQTHLGS